MRSFTIVALTLGLAAAAAPADEAASLFAPGAPVYGWTFDNGQEFPGATGKLSVDAEAKHNGKASLRLDGDFTKGGNYVQAATSALPDDDIRAIALSLRYPGHEQLTLRVIDQSGQCHQLVLKVQPGDDWQQVIFPLREFFAKRGTPDAVTSVLKYEFWGGPSDGKWHGPCKSLVVLIGPSGDKKVCTLWLGDVAVIPALAAGVVQAASFKCDFESGDALPAGWQTQGKVAIDGQNAFKGQRSLLLSWPPEDVAGLCTATGPSFPVKPGLWELSLACKADLKSPDSSFNGAVALEVLDASGKVLDRVTLADTFGQRNWQPISKRVQLPPTAAAARFHAWVGKPAGRFWIDELSAAYVSAPPAKDNRVERIVFGTAQSGNLLLPGDARTVSVRVEATKPLDDNQRELSYTLRDYWGAECTATAKTALGPPRREGERYIYEASIDLAGAPVELGRYYELHAEITRAGDEPFHNYTSLAILPQPVTKQYKPEEIPFTSRNWDGNIGDFFFLADRLGVRISNVWSGWSSEAPYAPQPGRVDLCAKLGMGVIAGAPTGAIERRAAGWEKYDDKALRQGVRNWIAQYGNVRPLWFSLGNEPPVIADYLATDVAGYKSVYEEIKKVDPSIVVISTSIGAQEPFFQAGFQNYCDVLDFHAYEDWQGIRQTFEAYDKLFAKYGGRKPIWTTEIGLNSQGLARQTVATTLIKKITSFFACGGACVSWFDLGYPDGDAKLADDSTSAHNVFDCRYARYCPKLDAIAYYNMINGICIKKPVGQKMYDADTYAFLFRDRDSHCLQVLWKEKGRRDVLLPLPGVGKVTAIDIDGRRSELDAGGKGLTLTINEDPLLLLYDSGDAPLAEKLGAPAAELAALPPGIVKGGSTALTVGLHSTPDQDVDLVAPALWTVTRSPAASDQRLTFTVTTPETTTAREGDLIVKLKNAGGGCGGELRGRVAVTGRLTVRLLPVPASCDKPAGVRLVIRNFAPQKQDVTWKLSLTGEIPMVNGSFGGGPTTPAAYFADAAEGTRTIDGRGAAEIVVPLAGVDPLNVYRVKASVSDPAGRAVVVERPMAGFAAAPRARSAINLDGSMTEADWKNAPVLMLNQARQYLTMDPKKSTWKGPNDLSGAVRFLWDEKYLYLGVKVVDDVFVNNMVDDQIWSGDGLQLLIDPAREAAEKPGKYDIAVAITKKGPQAWCYLSADAGAPSGAVKDIVICSQRLSPERGDMTYMLAIPWSRLAPFKPGVGADLGLCLVLNEDDGRGRCSHMGWFGDIESKQVDIVGDLLLGD